MAAIVIPGKAGVPVIINGYDASYSVVEGDWGLDRPGHIYPRIVAGPLLLPAIPQYSRGYYPAVGRRPGYGRREIEPPPNRRLPPPAQSYYRSWQSQFDPLPATIDPPAYPPPVIVAPQINARRGELDEDNRQSDAYGGDGFQHGHRQSNARRPQPHHNHHR